MKSKHTKGEWKHSDNKVYVLLKQNGNTSKITIAQCDFSHIRSAFALMPNTEEELEAKKLNISFDYNAEIANARHIAKCVNMHNTAMDIILGLIRECGDHKDGPRLQEMIKMGIELLNKDKKD